MPNGVEDLVDATVNKIKSFADVNSVIGSPIIINSKITLIPVSRISYGFGVGGSDIIKKNLENKSFFGGTGSGVSLSPVGFLVINNGEVNFLQVDAFCGALDRAVATAPDAIKKIISIFKKKSKKNKEGNDEPE